MKKISLLLFALSISLSIQKLSAQTQEIIKTFDDQAKIWNKGDLKGFMQTYWKSDSVVFMSDNGPIYGWQKIYEHYLKLYPDKESMGTLSFKISQVKVLCNNSDAHVIGLWHVQRESEQSEGYFTLLMHKFKEDWKFVVDHPQ